jgi:hypothetical protein
MSGSLFNSASMITAMHALATAQAGGSPDAFRRSRYAAERDLVGFLVGMRWILIYSKSLNSQIVAGDA